MDENEFNFPPASPQPMRPAFAQELNARLQAIPAQSARPTRPLVPNVRERALLIAGAALAVVALLVLSPGMRAVAARFLTLFRVQHITALAVDPARVESLRQNGLSDAGIESLIGDAMVEDRAAIEAQAQPHPVANIQAAAQETGLQLRVPAALTQDPASAKVLVRQMQTLHFKGNVARLNALIQAVGITDVSIPAHLEGAIVTVTKPAAVMMRWTQASQPFSLLQAPVPSVELPDGVDLAQLGEIGLRIIGVEPVEAHRIAQLTDWNSTLLVPIPTNVGSFRNVTLSNGATSLVVTTGGTGASEAHASDGERQRTMVVWVYDDMVYAITGGSSRDVIDAANSVQ